MNDQQTFAILFRRLPEVGAMPGLIVVKVDVSNGKEPPRTVGSLTDIAFRARLAHFGLHSANEVAQIREALKIAEGQATIHERWPNPGSCAQFWHGFLGSQIRQIDWVCGACDASHRENVGGILGESFLRPCRCGQATRITVTAKLMPPPVADGSEREEARLEIENAAN